MLQPQHAAAAPRQSRIMRRQDGGQPVLAVQALHQFHDGEGRDVRPGRRWAHRPATPPVCSPARARWPRAAARRRTVRPACAVFARPNRLPPAIHGFLKGLAKPGTRISSGMATFSAAVKSANRWCRCHTKPIRRLRNSASIASLRIQRFRIKVYCTARWRVQRGQQMQQSTFARAGRSNDGDNFARAKHEIDSVQNGDCIGSAAVNFAQRAGLEACPAYGLRGFRVFDRHTLFDFGHGRRLERCPH